MPGPRLARRDPEHDPARALRAWCDYQLGHYRAALLGFKTAVRRQPTWDGLYDGIGWSRLRLERPALAREAFRAAVDMSPDYADALVGLGFAHFALEQYEAALPPLWKALGRLEPALVGDAPREVADVRARIAWSLYYVGRYAEAAEAFERAIALRPDWYGLHNGLGWSYLRLGQKAQARAAFQRALGLRPGYDDAALGLRQASG